MFFFSYLERISCVGNELDEPHLTSDHVVKSPKINPVSIVINKPIASVLKPTFHNVESLIHKPKTIPKIGPYSEKDSFKKSLSKIIFCIYHQWRNQHRSNKNSNVYIMIFIAKIK